MTLLKDKTCLGRSRFVGFKPPAKEDTVKLFSSFFFQVFLFINVCNKVF